MLTVSVVICAFTEARWAALSAAMESLDRQSRRPDEIVLVIDHNDGLLERAGTRWPGVHVVPNAGQRGLSDARNTGVGAATGDVIAFLDDDAVAAADWLDRLLGGYDRPGVVAVGGRVQPAWEGGRPRWFPAEFDWVVGCSHAGMPTSPASVRNLIGAGMSFRSSILREVGGFRAELGRVGTTPVGCEETDLCIRARVRAGESAIHYDPGAVVTHSVPRSRATVRYFTDRCRAEGRSKAVLTALVGSEPGLSDERTYVRRTLVTGVAANLRAATAGDLGGVARAAAIAGGLAATGAGFVWERTRSVGRRRRGPRRAVGGEPRVLVVTPRFPPDIGGVERHVYEVARRLVARGCTVRVVCTDRTGRLPAREVVDGIDVQRVPAWPRDRDVYFAPRIWRAMADGEWDVVHVQSYHTLVAPLAMWRSHRLGIPFVLTFHGGGHSSRVRNAVRGLQRRALGPLVRRAARVIAVARFEVAWYSTEFGLPATRFTVIPNGTEPATSAAGPEPSDRADGEVIASIGRLERYKGHHRVLAAFAHVARERPEARLWIVGTGPEERSLRQKAQALGLGGRVEIRSVPVGDPSQMASLLAATRVVACLSEFETHPLAALEALAARRPLIVADTSGLRELADQGLAHAVALDADDETVARAIVSLLDDPVVAPVPSMPTWDDCAEALLGLYRDVACAS